jgi:hypothetical protein
VPRLRGSSIFRPTAALWHTRSKRSGETYGSSRPIDPLVEREEGVVATDTALTKRIEKIEKRMEAAERDIDTLAAVFIELKNTLVRLVHPKKKQQMKASIRVISPISRGLAGRQC